MSVSLSSVRFVAQQALRLGVRPAPRQPSPFSSPSLAAAGDASSPHLTPPLIKAWQAHWSLHRALTFTPRQMCLACLGLCVCLGGLALVDAVSMMGALWPLWGLTLALMVCCAFTWSRHAADRDVIALRPDLLRVERHRGGRIERTEFNPRWVRIEPTLDDRSLVCLSGQGKRVAVGAFLQRAQRRQLADEIRAALRHVCR